MSAFVPREITRFSASWLSEENRNSPDTSVTAPSARALPGAATPSTADTDSKRRSARTTVDIVRRYPRPKGAVNRAVGIQPTTPGDA